MHWEHRCELCVVHWEPRCALCVESLVVRTSSLAGSHGHSHFCTALSNVSLEHWAPPWSNLPPAGWPRHNQGFACWAMCTMRRQCNVFGDNETWKIGQTQYNVPESVVYLGSHGSESHEILAMTNLNTLQQQKKISFTTESQETKLNCLTPCNSSSMERVRTIVDHRMFRILWECAAHSQFPQMAAISWQGGWGLGGWVGQTKSSQDRGWSQDKLLRTILRTSKRCTIEEKNIKTINMYQTIILHWHGVWLS